ncbi:sensor histidine kinase [Sphingobacterium bovisgrunnientis]|jgi:two-component system phosphate regulon sensor histidine kinase PhoR|uniref:sensor histidine kinase n=1 Tax=Sphingobacterium bovisgrunnientis TaxID=1874697 RepID=UPI001359D3C4|nr:ATP-binding protein [Sphingobacterium bovisgrunnientis]
MNFRLLVFYISAGFSLSLASVSFFYAQDWQHSLLIMVVSFVISFIILTNILHYHIHTRISNIYKLIRSLKLGKDMKVVLAEHASEDPILSTEKEVRDWAIQKSSEIDQLKAQEKFRREFLSNISHEFKTPLFAIQGYIETLKDGMIEEDVEMANNFLNKASRNIDRLTYLLNDLDEISKLESGQISINLEKFDIVELILETVDHLIDKAQKQNIEIVIDLKNNSPIFVKADRQRIQQVLINLIDNSIKYGRDGGKTKVNIYPLLDQILVEVTDNGFGIEEKNIPRVFERFFRTDKSRSRDIGGSGLGLSIVKHIIEAHEQTVHARSTEGIGTTFGFTLAKSKAHH